MTLSPDPGFASGGMNVGLVCLALLVLRAQAVDVPFSPCPGYFDYFHGVVWMGRLSVPVPSTGFPIFTQVFLSLKAVLRSRYVGLIELADPVELAVDRIVNFRTRFVNYTVSFPLPNPLPSLTMVKVNNVTVCCCGQHHFGLFTTITLEHKFPTNPRYEYFTDPVTAPEPDISYDVCGRKQPTAFFQPLQLSGYGEWPWLVALLLTDSGTLEFHCTGNLLTDKHVITAAHCVKTRFGRHYAPRNFVVYLGKYDLTRWNETDSQIRRVDNVVIHPEYLLSYYSSDLAVLVLSEAVDLNEFVRPVCIWKDGPELHPYVGAVAGWGRDADRAVFNARPRMFYLPIVGQEECLRSRRDYFYVTSGTTFCAGLRNGSGPCNGDSGSGLVVPQIDGDNRTVWYLRGIVSLSLLDPYTQTCDFSNYLVFTDVAKFTDWISDVIETTF